MFNLKTEFNMTTNVDLKNETPTFGKPLLSASAVFKAGSFKF
jgi:hypothetical protein